MQVLKNEQNNGAGTQALRELYRESKERGFKSLKLRVFVDNPALNLYKRVGFIETERDDSVISMQWMIL